MDIHKHLPAKIYNFSLAFQQMCSMVAIGQTKSQDETLRELILQTLVLLPEEKISNELDFSKILNTLFGLQIAKHEIKYAIDQLTSVGKIRLSDSNNYVLNPEVHIALKKSIEDSIELEEKVREKWKQEISEKYPNFIFSAVWNALRNYLAGAFLRHGIQAVALLDSTQDFTQFFSQSLSELLNGAVKGFSDETKLDAKNAISSFVANTGMFPERATYITQLADGAFNYFNLASDPKTAEDFRKNLNQLILFLDTNFLFGILGITISPQVAVSNDLIRVIQEYKFPFTLRRHEVTDNELITSVTIYEADFSMRHWSKSISRAALTSRFISGVELKYHQEFIENGIDVKSFFLPYHHMDVLLNEKQIECDHTETKDEKSQLRIATLIADYEKFLQKKGRDKPYKTIEHDMTLLDVVRQIKSDTKSTLDAGALIITCDYSLYAFDWESSKKQGIKPCTVLPNLFWQIIRPFIPSDMDFSQVFAQTFAIPEFRTIGSGASEACSKMINILSAYKDFPEETAKRMLSNDILIDQLRRAESDEAFQNYIETAIVNENAQLLGENLLLAKEVSIEQTGKKEIVRKLEEANESIKLQDDKIRLEQEQREKAEKDSIIAKDNQQRAEEAASTEKTQRIKSEERLRLILAIIKAVVLGMVSVIIFELLIYKIPWLWLITNKNSYGLQGCIDFGLIALCFLLFVSKWRKLIWISLLLPVILIGFQLIGGPR